MVVALRSLWIRGRIAALIEKVKHVDAGVFDLKMEILNMEERFHNEIDLARLSLQDDLQTIIVPEYMEKQVKDYIVQTLRTQSLDELLNSQVAGEMRQLKQSLQQFKRQHRVSERPRTIEERRYAVGDAIMKTYKELQAKVEVLERVAEERETRLQRLESESSHLRYSETLNPNRSSKELEARVEVLEHASKQRETHLQQLVSENRQLRYSEMFNLRRKVSEVEARVEVWEHIAEKRETQLQQLKSENAQLRLAVEKLNQSRGNAELEDRTEALEQTMEERDTRLRQLESDSLELSYSVERLNKDFEVSEDVTEKCERRLQRLESEDVQLKNLLEMMNHSMTDELSVHCKCSSSKQETKSSMASSTIPTNTITTDIPQEQKPSVFSCGEGWKEMHRACYKFDKRKMSWNAAKQACREEGGNLISLSSYAEKKKISRELQKEITEERLLTWWVGLRWNSDKRKFLWEDDGPFSRRITRWGPGEPNNGRGRRVEHCVELKYNGYLNDEECAEQRPFICERHGITPRPTFLRQ